MLAMYARLYRFQNPISTMNWLLDCMSSATILPKHHLLLDHYLFLFVGLSLLFSLFMPWSGVNASVYKPKINCPPVSPNLLQDAYFSKMLPIQCVKSNQQALRKSHPASSSTVVPKVSASDTFGYTFDDTVAPNWISATTNSGLVGDDEFLGPVDIGFSFPFYGINQTKLYFSTNGLITFGAGSADWNEAIPSMFAPNNLIAPFWNDFVVGSPDNSGAIYTLQDGVAPNRYFVIEWRNVTFLGDTVPFSFEAVLYENGDIVFQSENSHDAYVTVGIEDYNGTVALEYPPNLASPMVVHFYYPLDTVPRVSILPYDMGDFTFLNQVYRRTLTVANTGNAGTDTFDLTVTSDWPLTLYRADGITPLTDTDGDGVMDTGPIAQGAALDIIVEALPSGGGIVGDSSGVAINARSSLDVGVSRSSGLETAIPAPFAQIYHESIYAGPGSGKTTGLRLISPDSITQQVEFPVVVKS